MIPKKILHPVWHWQPFAVLTVLAFVAAKPFQQTFQTNPAVIKTENGLISGTKNSRGDVVIFRGIPFAAPPLNELRWRPPQPVVPWQGIRKCDRFSASAMQDKPVPFSMWSKEFMAPETPLSEDCLYLNVWAAAHTPKGKNPVLVWIHGGGFTGGSGSVPIYDGEAMARKGVLFVTINYRLGIFGFFAHPELSSESGHHASGNYGIMDQIAALKWVQKNIAAFGGDPERITIDGQSAGSFSVNALMASPLAKGLFQRAIGQSGASFNRSPLVRSLEEAEKSGLQLANSLQLTSLAALRAKPAEELLKVHSTSSLITDGYVLPADIYSIFVEGKQNDVPLLTGWNADEGLSFGPPQDAATFEADAEKKYGIDAPSFLEVYPAHTDEEAMRSQKALSRDQLFAWQDYTWAGLQSRKGTHPAFLYYFSRVPPGKPEYGAFHSSEIAYALGNLYKWNRPWGKTDRDLSDLMTAYWVNFARTGNPNKTGLPVWPAFNDSQKLLMELGDHAVSREIPTKKAFDFMDHYEAGLRNPK